MNAINVISPYRYLGMWVFDAAAAFPGHQFRLEWRRADSTGNWYYSPQLEMEGWLCPALLRYFPEAPKELYVQVKSLSAYGLIADSGSFRRRETHGGEQVFHRLLG
jgi:hypothetical protein